MRMVKIKQMDGIIVHGYDLDLVGEFQNKYRNYTLILIPPNNRDECPCLVFADYSRSSKYQYREIDKFPFINLSSKSEVNQFLKAYNESLDFYKKKIFRMAD